MPVFLLAVLGLAGTAAAQSRPSVRAGASPRRAVAQVAGVSRQQAHWQDQPTPADESPQSGTSPTRKLQPISQGHVASSSEESFLDEHVGCDACGGAGCNECGDGSDYDWCGPCDPHGWLGGGGWGRIDYLLWWGSGVAVRPLATTSPQASFGVLGAPGTKVIAGGTRFDNDIRSGARVDFGVWLSPSRKVGLGGNFFALQTANTSVDLLSTGDPLLARPFFNISTNAQDAAVVAAASQLEGSIRVRSSSDVLGAEAYLRQELVARRGRRLDALYGYRFAQLNESFDIYDRAVVTDPGGIIPLGTILEGVDQFDTRNTFHGGEMGLLLEEQYVRWSWQVIGRIALGNMHQNAIVDGISAVTVPGLAPVTSEGNLLALPTNIGQYQRNQFAVIPEIDLTLGYQLTTRWRANVGYSFIYIGRVAQAARQIDASVNPTQIGGGALVGQARPEFVFRNSDFWLQGLNFGLECRF